MDPRTIEKVPIRNEVIRKALEDIEEILHDLDKKLGNVVTSLDNELKSQPDDSKDAEMIDCILDDLLNEIPNTIDFMNALYSYCETEEEEPE